MIEEAHEKWKHQTIVRNLLPSLQKQPEVLVCSWETVTFLSKKQKNLKEKEHSETRYLGHRKILIVIAEAVRVPQILIEKAFFVRLISIKVAQGEPYLFEVDHEGAKMLWKAENNRHTLKGMNGLNSYHFMWKWGKHEYP